MYLLKEGLLREKLKKAKIILAEIDFWGILNNRKAKYAIYEAKTNSRSKYTSRNL